MSLSKEREDYVYMAKIAERAKLYEDMVDWMEKVAMLGVEFTVEERNLLIVACKNGIGTKRAKYRTIYSIEKEEEAKGNTRYVKNIKEYQQTVVSELVEFCMKIITMIDEHLIPSDSREFSVFYGQLKGDYYRYLAEFQSGNEKQKAVKQSLRAYQDATAVAEAELVPIHPYRLSAVLKLSMFYAKSLGSTRRACESVGRAMAQLDPYLDSLSEESHRARTLIIGQMKDNIALWSSDASGPSEDSC